MGIGTYNYIHNFQLQVYHFMNSDGNNELHNVYNIDVPEIDLQPISGMTQQFADITVFF